MRKWILAGFGIGLLMFPLVVNAQSDDWRVEKDKDGIQVRTRKTEESPVKAFQGKTRAAVSVDEAVAFFENEQTDCDWIYQCKEFRVLENINAEEHIVYFHQDMPWPVSDRDVVYHRIRKKDPATGVVTFILTDVKGAHPELNAGVRLATLKGKWTFTPAEGGGVEIFDEQQVDPGGVIPKWLVNKLIVDVPFETLKKFREMLETENK